ncbi:MAG: EamA family transporter [Desulfobacteraceae bacterium]|nr:EamA family transporter [Desulfobacteraceae bacterium]
MFTWYSFALLSLFLMGTQRFLYKVSAEKRCNTAWTTFSFMGTVAAMSSVLFLLTGEPVLDVSYLLLVGLANGGSFSLATVAHIEALKHLPVSVAYPIIRLNVVIVVFFSILYFRDRLSYLQMTGILIAVTAFALLAKEGDRKEETFKDRRWGFFLVMLSTFSGAAASITSKFAAVHTNMLAYMAISYIASMLFSFGMRNRLQTEKVTGNRKLAMIIGLTMGLLNFGGYFLFLRALSTGPLSLVVPIIGMAFVIPIVLSALIYKETLTPFRIVGIAMTIVSVVLLRL